MLEFDNATQTPARQAVEIFRSSHGVSLEREDVEVAASLVYGDDHTFIDLFDVTTEIRKHIGANHTPHFSVSFEKIRRFAAERIEAGDIAALESRVGGSLPEECSRRLRAADEDPALASHHKASAADHYAADVVDSLTALLGLSVSDVISPVHDGFEPSRIADLPYLGFLPETMEQTNA